MGPFRAALTGIPIRACERSVSGRIAAQRSNLILVNPLTAPLPLRDPPLHAPLPLHCFPTRPLTAPLPLTRFTARSAPFSAPLTLHLLSLLDPLMTFNTLYQQLLMKYSY